MNHVRWGEHRGGMFIAVTGIDGQDRPMARSWHLLAEGDDGPLIHSMAIEAIIRRSLGGLAPAPGARAAVRELELADYDTLFAKRTIVTGVRDDAPARARPLFEQVLGEAWLELPEPVRQMHTTDTARASGRCNVTRGKGWLANWVATLFGFPQAAIDLPVSVRFQATPQQEHWTRSFGTQVFRSTLSAGRGRAARLLVERIGLLDFEQALIVEEKRLRLELRGWRLFGIALPAWLAPESNSYESEIDGRFQFHVEIRHRWLGLLVRYKGWLTPG